MDVQEFGAAVNIALEAAAEATLQERKRCVAIVQEAREENNADLRSIIAQIKCGE